MSNHVPHPLRCASFAGVALALLTVGCAGEPQVASLHFDEDRGAVWAVLPEELVDELGALPVGRDASQALRVEVLGEAEEMRVDRVFVHGTVALEGTALAFEPSFPFMAGVRYLASLDGDVLAEWSRCPGSFASATLEFRIEPEMSTKPEVIAVYPSGPVLPENLLRMYVHFSEPMRQGVAWDHLRLEDERGQEIELGLLELDHELWDPSGTRLTLLFDPGRIKSGLVPNREVGRPLEGQPSFSLVLDAAWPSAAGETLGAQHRSTFEVGPADHEQPRPEEWVLRLPTVGSREPLVIAPGQVLDRGMLARSLRVELEQQVFATSLRVGRGGPGERTLELFPERHWIAGSYELRVDPRLEDPSGNSVRRPFETDLEEEESATSSNAEWRTVRFELVSS